MNALNSWNSWVLNLKSKNVSSPERNQFNGKLSNLSSVFPRTRPCRLFIWPEKVSNVVFDVGECEFDYTLGVGCSSHVILVPFSEKLKTPGHHTALNWKATQLS